MIAFFLGEDGPTHPAVEHAAALRTIPGTNVFRPAVDGNEVRGSWLSALSHRGHLLYCYLDKIYPI